MQCAGFVAIYQGSPLGSNPTVTLRANATGAFQHTDFKVVLTEVSATQTLWELWVRTPWPWFSQIGRVIHLYQTAGLGGLTTYDNGVMVANASAGVQTVAMGWGGGTTVDGSGGFPTANPNERVYRTDRKTEYYYDSGAGVWLSTTLYEYFIDLRSIPVQNASGAPINPLVLPRPLDSASSQPIWIRTNSFQLVFQVAGGTALSASHKWMVQINSTPNDSLLGYVTIDSGALNTNRQLAQMHGGEFNTSMSHGYLLTTKTGTPGGLYLYGMGLSYRFRG